VTRSGGTDLTGKVALVTGATGDMGSAFCRGLALAGADLVLTSRTEARLAGLSAQIKTDTGRRVAYLPCDLSDRAAAADLADRAWESFGRVDVVVNNAVPDGLQVAVADLLGTPDELWASALELIVFGPLALAKRLVPKMAAGGGGSFVNIVSGTGTTAVPGFDAYGFAKGGLILLTKYMAREWGRWNIRANAVSPGLVINPRMPEVDEPLTISLLERTALGRKGAKEEVVGAVVYFASPASSFVSGELLTVNGGRF
jgi:NAD(P)-dependent dehydrogenase (short-subunit alcohol dehydrogenase family)